MWQKKLFSIQEAIQILKKLFTELQIYKYSSLLSYLKYSEKTDIALKLNAMNKIIPLEF